MSEANKASPAALADAGAAHTRWWDGLLGDAELLDALLADDWTFYHPYGGFGTKAAFLGSLRSGQRKYDSIKDMEPLFRMHGQTAIVTGRVDIQFQWEDKPELER